MWGYGSGHSGNPSDFANLDVDNAMRRLKRFLLTIDEMKDWLSVTSNCKMVVLDRFIDFPQMFDKSGIYMDFKKVHDEYGFFHIRHLKPYKIEAGYSKVGDDWVILFLEKMIQQCD